MQYTQIDPGIPLQKRLGVSAWGSRSGNAKSLLPRLRPQHMDVWRVDMLRSHIAQHQLTVSLQPFETSIIMPSTQTPLKLDSALLAASIANAVLYLAIVRSSPSLGRMVVKTLSTTLLSAFAAARGGSVLLVAALALGSLGDAFLAWDDDASFLYGLSSFLTVHLLYAGLFFNSSGEPRLETVLTGWRAMVAGGLSILVPVMIALLVPRIGKGLRLPVVVYSIAIFGMAMTSLTLGNTLVIVGAVMFCSSDSILAADRFLVPRGSSVRSIMQYAVWILYYAGQLYIALGMLAADTGRLE
jgi:uncharacterized membrane protein YhhN